MAYTISCDASIKCKRGDVRGLIRHVARDVDKANGCECKHDNQQIDPGRTSQNETYVRIPEDGCWRTCTDTKQIEAAIQGRLSHVRKPLRKDAVVMRNVVLQMDPEWTKAHPEPDEQAEAIETMIDWAAEYFSDDNIVYYSIHKDETNPHIHLGICPVTGDGRLAQKDWFGSPTKLAAMHESIRQYMRVAEYDIGAKRKQIGDPSRHLTTDEYKQYKDWLDDTKKQMVQAAVDEGIEAGRARKREIIQTAEADADAIRAEARRQAQEAQKQAQADAEAQGRAIIAQAQEARKQAQEEAQEIIQEARAILSQAAQHLNECSGYLNEEQYNGLTRQQLKREKMVAAAQQRFSPLPDAQPAGPDISGPTL